MGYPETGQVTEIVPPSTDFTEGMGRTRGGPAREEEKENEMEIIARSGLLSRGGREGECGACGDYEAPFRGGKVLQYRKVGDERVTLN